nr:auxilin-like protein [Tanacetum cinerariifolium]
MVKDMEVHFDMTMRQKAVFESLCAPHAQDFLLAIPIDGLDQYMSPVEYRTILKYRLMILLFSVDAIGPVCCKACLDSFGEHVVHCKELSGFKYRHDMVLFYIGRRVGISAKKEAPVNFITNPSDGRSTLRSADVLVFGWVEGKHACVDLTGVYLLVGLSSRGFTAEYFNEDYDEEREMKPRQEPARAVTPPLRAASPWVCRRRKRVVGFEESQNRGENRVERNSEGGRPLEKALRGNGSQNVNLPLLLAAHIGRSKNGQSLQSSLTSAYGGQALPNNIGGNLPPNAYVWVSKMPAYANPNPTGLFPTPLSSVTPFVRCIKDYPLPDGLKIPSHIGSYDGKGDPDNFLHLLEGAIRMQKWLMPVACHMFTYTLKDSARIWWNSQKEDNILDYEDLKAKF